MNQYQPFQTPVQMSGMQYNQPQKKVYLTNPLGEEKVKELLSKGNRSKGIAISEEDVNKALCTHRLEDQSYLVPIGDGRVRCRICGEEFTPVEATDEEIKIATQNLVDLWNSAKFMNVDMPQSACIEFYTALAYLKKTPEICKLAHDNINNYYTQVQQFANGFQPNPWDQYGMIVNQSPANMMMYPGTQQAYSQYQQPVPQMQQPVMQQPYDNYYNPAAQAMQAAAPGSNGFGTTAPTPAAPQQPIPTYQPVQTAYTPTPAPSPAPAQPSGGAVVTKTVTE